MSAQSGSNNPIVVNDIYLSVAKITTLMKEAGKEKPLKNATGFFYSGLSDQVFLITNKHVVIEPNENYYPDTVRVRLHVNPTNIRENQDYDIPLYHDGETKSNRSWREHFSGADVVAIPVNYQDLNKRGFLIKAFNAKNLLPSTIRLAFGEDVVVMGYPLGEYYDKENNLPVMRDGMIASVYPVPFRGNPYFLVDARLHKGTSGSPVITKEKSTWLGSDGSTMVTGSQFFLLGVNSSTFSLAKDVEPLGLNAVIFASIVDQLVNQS